MGKPKIYLRKSINLGKPGERPRVIAEEYIEKYGNQAFSKLCRKLICAYFSYEPAFSEWKKRMTIAELKDIGKEIRENIKIRDIKQKELVELGMSEEEISDIIIFSMS